jgi:glycosyltransferase involved in cell wall biosynthesis
MRVVLIGDGDSPHLLKWARALALRVDLWAVSSRGFLPGFDGLVPARQRLALGLNPDHAGGNTAILKRVPQVAAWLRAVDADWLHAHYLTSHGTLAWAARKLAGLRAQLVGSAWGSDILVTPDRHWAYLWATRTVLGACALTTSDSRHMAERMRQLGAREVMTFPFGLEAMPPEPGPKAPWRFFANRGLEPLYDPERVLRTFATVAAGQPAAELVVANDGSLRPAMEAVARNLGLRERVRFVGRLDAATQAAEYDAARWFLSLPRSDSVSVSVLEALAHGCWPLLSDLPANRELAEAGPAVTVLGDGESSDLPHRLQGLLDADGAAMTAQQRAWVAQHGLFEPAVARFVTRLEALTR